MRSRNDRFIGNFDIQFVAVLLRNFPSTCSVCLSNRCKFLI
uniref:Uncharacterized protein n=1 Tax=Onchocerca volvulus TaxID=6282 RepID=A0A8R1TJD7_ONCVO